MMIAAALNYLHQIIQSIPEWLTGGAETIRKAFGKKWAFIKSKQIINDEFHLENMQKNHTAFIGCFCNAESIGQQGRKKYFT